MPLDYAKLGFKCGLEIHQQLEGKKLFCACLTEIRKESPDFSVKRRLRAAAGESGSKDKAAEYEQTKQKEFVYQGYHNATCLVELDEEPPNEINHETLKIAVQVAQLLNCKMVDMVLFMRKTVVDGSNTSAFQRTALIGRNGFIDVNGKKICVDTVCLEEEACQVIERKDKQDVYNLSRLGIPLIEIATDASISSPEECKEAAAKIGMILRSVPGMKRGIGSIRQDVNVSIKGGARTEVKGFQDFKAIPKVVEYEVNRQLQLIKDGKKPEEGVRKAEPDFTTSFLRPMPGADRMYPETDVPPIKPPTAELGNVELLEDKANKFIELGLSKDLAFKTVKSKKLVFFEKILKQCPNIKPAFVAETLISYDSDVKAKQKEAKPELITEQHLETVFSALNEDKISKSSLLEVLTDISIGKKLDLNAYALVSDKELENEVKKTISATPNAPPGAIIGAIMAKYKGRVDGKKVAELISKLRKVK